MNIVNIEIKARCNQIEQIEKKLLNSGASYHGQDHQIDTYFRTNCGRLKLRKGNIEHSLIFYQRIETKGLKHSDVILHKFNGDSSAIRRQLEASMGIKTIVDKLRKIFFIENVKFHIDEVKDLGNFIEIEAIGKSGEEEVLRKQCQAFVDLLDIKDEDFVEMSYSDMMV